MSELRFLLHFCRFSKLFTVGLLCALSCIYLPSWASGQIYDPSKNFKIADLVYNLTGTFSVQYNNNILSATPSLSDWILTPGLNFKGALPLTKHNVLDLSFSLGYAEYIHHPNFGSGASFINLGPDTRISLAMQMGAFTVTPFDSVTFKTDPTGVQTPTGISGAQGQQFARFNNQIGVNTSWKMNRKTTPYLNIYRSDQIPIKNNNFLYAQYHAYTFNPGFKYDIASNLQLGVDIQANINRYKINFQNNSTNYVFGGNANWTVTPSIVVVASGSYTTYLIQSTGVNGDTGDSRGLQWQLSWLQILRPNLQYRLFTSQNFTLGYVTNTTRVRDFGGSFQWRVFQKTTFRGAIVYERGLDSGTGADVQRYNSTTFGLGIDYAWSYRMSISFDFENVISNSNLAGASFTQRQFVLGIAYDF